MAQVEIELTIRCSECGSDLKFSCFDSRTGSGIEIDPCHDCMSSSYDKGYEEGRE